jgi:hypothetical protein
MGVILLVGAFGWRSAFSAAIEIDSFDCFSRWGRYLSRGSDFDMNPN